MEDSKKYFKFHGRPGEDFDLWAARTEAALAPQDLLDVVATNVVGTADDDNPLAAETVLKVSKARALIMQGLDSKPLRICLSDKDNPYDMWSKLRERYAVSNISTQIQLQMKLNRLRYSDQVMTDFVDQFEEIFNRLEGMKCPYAESMQVAILLSAFGEKSKSSCGPVVAALQTTEGVLTWESVTARLLQEYDENQWNRGNASNAGSVNGVALYTFVPHRPQNGGGARKPYAKGKCHFCGQYGHFIRDCHKRKLKEKER